MNQPPTPEVIAISAAVHCLPPELCRLTAAYLTERPHTWTPIEKVEVVDGPDFGTNIRGFDTMRFYPWKTLASTKSFVDGHLSWTVDCCASRQGIDRWIGIGVTASPTNRSDEVCEFHGMASANDWMVCPAESRTLYLAHDGRMQQMFDYGSTNNIRLSFRFDVDPVGGTVNACIDVRSIDDRIRATYTILLLTASTPNHPRSDAPDYRLLRPCIAVAGRMELVVWSGRK